jgi:hypothetical protein
MAALAYSVLRDVEGVPAEVVAALEPGPTVLVRALEGARTTAYLVASVDRREVEVFHLADPGLGRPDGAVLATARFRDVGGQAFHDRLRQSPLEEPGPGGRVQVLRDVPVPGA